MTAEGIILVAIPFFVISMIAEALWLRGGRRGTPYQPIDTAASLSMGIGYLVIEGGWRFVDLAIFSVLYDHRVADLGRGPLLWLGAIIGWDFLYYWYHRAGHEVRFFWAAHVIHHSSRHCNLSTALRQTWWPFFSWMFFAPMALLGVPPALIATAGALNLIYQYWVHTETIRRLPAWFEYVLNTPSHHRVHHGSNREYLDRNYAGIFMLWDRWFGSFEPERARVEYGLTKNITTFNPIGIATHEWLAIARDVLAARSWKDRLGFVLRYPGWRPGRGTAG